MNQDNTDPVTGEHGWIDNRSTHYSEVIDNASKAGKITDLFGIERSSDTVFLAGESNEIDHGVPMAQWEVDLLND